MTRVVALDWNGTVASDVERAAYATTVVLNRRGRPGIDAEQFRDQFCLPLARYFEELGIDEPDLAAAEHEWNAVMIACVSPLSPGIAGALRLLRARGDWVGVVSAASEASVLADARRGEVDGLFDFVTGSCRDKEAALARLVNAGRGEVFYVGDTEYDMMSASAAGAVPIGFAGGYRPAESLSAAGARIVIDSMAQLAEALDSVVGRSTWSSTQFT